MVSEVPLVLRLLADTTGASAEIRELQDAINQQAREWKIARNTMLRQIREGFALISSLMSSFRQAMSLLGAQIDPFYSALIGMVLSTASMLISSATTLALTGIGGAAAAVILGLAISFQILTLAKLVADKEKTDGILTALAQAVASTSIGTPTRQIRGGLGGF